MSEPNIAHHDCKPIPSPCRPIPLDEWPPGPKGVTLKIPDSFIPFRAGYFCLAGHAHGPDSAVVDGIRFFLVQPVGRFLVACHMDRTGHRLCVSVISAKTKTARVQRQVSVAPVEELDPPDHWVRYLRMKAWWLATAEAAIQTLRGRQPRRARRVTAEAEAWLRTQLATLGHGADEQNGGI